MMVDHGILSWTMRAEESEGADGSEKVPNQWIGGLTDSREATPFKKELGHV